MPPGERLSLCPSHPCAPFPPPSPCRRLAELVTTGLSTFSRTSLQLAPSHLASVFISDLMGFFTFLFFRETFYSSASLFLVLPLLSHQPCEGFTGLPCLLFAPRFTQTLNSFVWAWPGLLFFWLVFFWHISSFSEQHLFLVVLRLFQWEWHHVLHSKALSLCLIPRHFNPVCNLKCLLITASPKICWFRCLVLMWEHN